MTGRFWADSGVVKDHRKLLTEVLYPEEGGAQGRTKLACPEDHRILSVTTGRLRMRLPPGAATEANRPRVESELSRRPGVQSAHVNPLTGNALVYFDPRRTTAHALVAAAGGLGPVPPAARVSTEVTRRALRAPSRRALVQAGMRGLLGHALVDAVFYALVFAEPFGLPLAALGGLHLAFDVVAWTAALAPLMAEAAGTSEGGRTIPRASAVAA
jgi:hypothetical protein